MKASYKREMRHNYLILEAMEENLDSFELKMLAGNSIEGLLKFRMKQEEQARFYYYEITSKQPLSRLLEFREVHREELASLISGIASTLSWVENYLLQESNILLEPEYIYIDPENFRVWLCYVPGYHGDFPASMAKLLHFLLKKADHQDNETVVLAYRLYQESQKDYFGIEDLLSAVRESQKKEETEQAELTEEIPNAAQEEVFSRVEALSDGEERKKKEKRENSAVLKQQVICWLAVLFISPAVLWMLRGMEGLRQYGLWVAAAEVVAGAGGIFLWPKLHPLFLNQRKNADPEKENWYMTIEKEETEERDANDKSKESAMEEGEKEPYRENYPEGFGADTVLLAEADEGGKGVHLLKSLDLSVEDIPVPYFPFIIGKQEGITDYVLSRETVSRLHLRIDEENKEYKVTDLNSSNGTKVGERILEANETCPLHSGDRLTIADLSFIFY